MGRGPAHTQYSAYDGHVWSLMSYLPSSTNDFTSAKYSTEYSVRASWYNNTYPTTPMLADILAIQRIYGTPTSTPLSGGQVFGFNCNITGAIRPFFDFTQNTNPVITI